jgi:nucleoid-associated protein YgaU
LTQAVDRLDPTRWEDPDLITMQRNARSERPAEPPRRLLVEDEPPARAGEVRAIDPLADQPAPTTVEMGGLTFVPVPDDGISLAEEDLRGLTYIFHDVQAGESLTAICRRYYGDASLVEDLAKYNGLKDPNHVTAGTRLRIPADAALVRGDRPAATMVANRSPAPPSDQKYTVREGDNLSKLASKFLGSRDKYLVLYEHNRDVLENPDAIRPGMTLKIPRRVD